MPIVVVPPTEEEPQPIAGSRLRIIGPQGDIESEQEAQRLNEEQNVKPPQSEEEQNVKPRIVDTQGNPVDLNRPIIQNKDGTISTEETITIEVDGKFFNIPTIVNGTRRSDDDATRLWREGVNKAVGVFDSQEDATTAAEQRSKFLRNVRTGVQISDAPIPETMGEVAEDIKQALNMARLDVQAALHKSAASANTTVGNIAMLINNATDYLSARFGGANSKDTYLKYIEEWLFKTAAEEQQRAQDIGAPETIPDQVLQGLIQAPEKIAEYALAINYLGPALGFGLVDVVAGTGKDDTAEAAAIRGAEGALIGKVFNSFKHLTYGTKVTASTLLGGAQAAAHGGDVEDMTVSGLTLGILSSLTPGAPRPYTHRVARVDTRDLATGEGKFPGLPLEGNLYPSNGRIPFSIELEQKIQDLKTELNGISPTPKTPEAQERITGIKNRIAVLEKIRSEQAVKDGIKDVPDIVREQRHVENELINLGLKEDTRSFGEFKYHNFTTEHFETTNNKGETTTKVISTPDKKDIGPLRRDISSSLAPGKFVGDLHPLMKWAISKIDTAIRSSELKTQELLWAKRPHPFLFGTARRTVNLKPTDKGGLTLFDRLPLKSQEKLLDVAWKWDRAGIEPDLEIMQMHGLNPVEVRAYKNLRRMVEEVRLINNAAIIKTAPPGTKPTLINKRSGYLPHVTLGDWRIFVRQNSDGKLTDVFGVQGKLEATRLLSSLEKQFPDHTFSLAPTRRGNNDRSIDAYKDALRQLDKDPAASAALEKAFQTWLLDRGQRVHAKARQGVGGFKGTEGGRAGVQSFIEAMQHYVEGGVRQASMLELNADINRALLDPSVAKNLPNASVAIERHLNNALGEVGIIDRALTDWTRDAIGEEGLAKGLGTVRQATLIAKLMMGNVRFLMAQGIQPYQAVIPRLIDLKLGHGVDGHIGRTITLAEKDFWYPSKEAQEALQYAFDNGVVNPKFVKEGLGEGRFWAPGSVSLGQAAFETLTGQRLAGRFEEYARMKAFLMFYHFGRNAGMSAKDAKATAAYLTDMYMVEYKNNTRPLIYGALQGGPLGANIGLFKTYQHNYLAQQVDYLKKAADNKPEGLAAFTAMQLFTSGLKGVVGLSLADSALNYLGFPTLTEQMLKSGVPDSVMWGVPSAALDMDLTSTIGAPGLNPGDLLSMPGFEYVGQVTFDGLTWLYRASREHSLATPADAQRFWLSALPTSFHGAVERYYARGDKVMSPVKGGILATERTENDWLKRYMSARSLDEARQAQAIWQLSLIKERKHYNLDVLADATAWSWLLTNEIPDWSIDSAMRDFKTMPPDFISMVRDRRRRMVTTTYDTLTDQRTRTGRENTKELKAMDRKANP